MRGSSSPTKATASFDFAPTEPNDSLVFTTLSDGDSVSAVPVFDVTSSGLPDGDYLAVATMGGNIAVYYWSTTLSDSTGSDSFLLFGRERKGGAITVQVPEPEDKPG